MMKKFALPILLLATSFCLAACSDDDENDSSVRTIDKWIGSPCTCEGDGCAMLGIPLPSPVANATIKGCENVDLTGVEGGQLACLQTIPAAQASLAPPTYFPQGYCTISAVGCEGSIFCSSAAYGDVNKMAACPSGSVMIESKFDYAIAKSDSHIVNKTCAKTCNSDKDCNGAGEMSCIKRDGVKFCYNEQNFSFMGDDIKFTKF
ncbi:MAG: hypothetical protein J6A01_00850 [Proteobacteria bacterium]|nr:hypothetical protein [Pseudomonadota bacterium]